MSADRAHSCAFQEEAPSRRRRGHEQQQQQVQEVGAGAARSGQGTMGGHHMRWPTPFSDALGAELAVSARRTGFLEFVYEQGKYTRESADMTALL